MQNTITLPPTTIKARTPTSMGGRGHPDGRPLTPPLMKAMAEHQRLRAYLNGDWQPMLNSLLTDAQRNKPHLTGPLKDDLTASHYADQYMCRSPQATAEQAWRQGSSAAKSRGSNISTTENELSGDVFSPIKALSHAISGQGTPLQVKIENTGIIEAGWQKQPLQF